MDHKLEIYGQDDCRFCAAAVAFCDKRGLPYVYLNMTSSPILRVEMLERAPGAKTAPQIFIGPHRIGGFDDLQRSYPVVQQILGG
jgi:glutaredoxin 3